MDFNAVQQIIRQAIHDSAQYLPPRGSKVTGYDPVAVDVLRALDREGFTVERKGDA